MKKKLDRNQALVLIHKEHPSLSYSELGRPFGISKQRVHKILQDTPEKKHWIKTLFNNMCEAINFTNERR